MELVALPDIRNSSNYLMIKIRDQDIIRQQLAVSGNCVIVIITST